MKPSFLWIGLFAQGWNLVLGSPEPVPISEAEVVGTTWTGEMGIQESTARLMAREERLFKVSKRRFQMWKPTVVPDLDSMPPAPWLPKGPSAGNPTPPDSPILPYSPTVGFSFTAATLADASGFPPDPMGAVGPTQFLLVINGRVRTFNKNTGTADGVLNTTTDNFFSSVMTPPISNNFTSDPRVRFDRLSGRWFVTIIDVPGLSGSLPNRVLLAVSDSATITAQTTWTYFYFQQDLVSPTGDTGKFADYPTLGIDAHALYIGANIFGSRGNPSAFSNTSAFVVRKNSVLSGGPIVVSAFRNLIGKVQGVNTGPYTPQGVDNYDPSASEGYIIGVDTSSFARLQLRRISNPGGTPAISGNVAITIAATAEPIRVPHLGNTGGSSGDLDGLDNRLLAAHVRNGRLWTSHNIGVNNTGGSSGTITRNAVRWYELQGIASGQSPSVFQSGTLFQPSSSNSTDQRHYWMGTIMVSGQGHAVMGFSVAGLNEHANAGTVGRLAGDTLGTMGTPILYTSSTAAYNPPGDPGGTEGRRWGDYSYTSLDPNDDMSVWTVQEFCDSANSYGLRVARLLAPPPATPSNCNPSSVAAGAANIDVVISGLSADGSGFFEPGTGFPNHLSATVNGGSVTVNGVTFADPTHVTIRLSVAGSALEGSRTITVTNPDGQSATSASGILTILSSGTSNRAPELATISDRTVDEQTLLSFSASATDADGDLLTFSLEPGAPAGASINSTNGLFTWTPTEAQGPSTNLITVRVTDDGSPPASDIRSFTVVVDEVNRAPVLTVPTDQVIHELSTLVVTNTATDADLPANSLTFSLEPGAPAGASLNATSGVFTWAPSEAQGPSTNLITVRVTDNGSPPASDIRSFTVVVDEVNRAPVLTVPADQVINELSTLVVTNTATDADLPANTLTFSLEPGAPAGASLNATNGVFTWTPTESQGPSTNLITIRVTDDGSPPASDIRSFTVVVNEVNLAPVLTVPADQVINELSTLVVTNTATDADLPANTLTFSLEPGAPAGASLNTTNGVFTWTPTESQGPSTNLITVRVTDDGSPPASDIRSFTVVVDEVNLAPVLTVPADQVINELSTLTLTNTAADADLPANSLTFSLEPGAPAGASLNPTSGVFTWTPTESQGPSTNRITVRVTDDGSPPASDIRSFTVVVDEVNLAPVLTVPADQVIDELSTLVVTNTAADADLPANSLTFSLEPGAPAGASLNATNGVFTWTPTETQGPSTNLITIRVTDDGSPPASDIGSFTIIVNEVNAAPVLAPIRDQVTFAGIQLAITNSVMDSDYPTNILTFSLDSGAPDGAVINPADGVFTWTPPSSQAPGTNRVTVRVTDSGIPSLSDVQSFTIVVASPPVIESIVASEGTIVLRWTTIPGKRYQVQYTPDLDEPQWTDLGSDITAVGSTATQTDITTAGSERYYRIVLRP